MDSFAAEDIAAMREEGDLAAFMRLRLRPVRDTVKVIALWQRLSDPGDHVIGAWPSTAPLPAQHQRAPGDAARCHCSRCRTLGAPCEADPCRCPLCGAHRNGAAPSRVPQTAQS
ncbi:hypothetical protein ACIGZI_35345 [Streptomyces griseus]|uniref:hypothetical protein n=1 Tax=Streptomyces griseus TaxID=1911 RepID=UPI0037D68B83